MNRYSVGLDVEGILANPRIDMAWYILDNLISKETHKRFYDRVGPFDEYDDARWLYERADKGHSTGTAPLISLFIAACDGLDDKGLIEAGNKIIQKNPGVDKLMNYLMEEKGITPLLITSSYPAIPLELAQEYGIPPSSVFSCGYSIQAGYDLKDEEGLEEEVEARSQLSLLGKYRQELSKFLETYFDVCGEMLQAYRNNNTGEIGRLKTIHDDIFGEVESEELRIELECLLLYENGIMGAHNKARALSVSPHKKKIYIGDSIVDADTIEAADVGIAINCTNEEALRSANISVAVHDFDLLIPLLGRILTADAFDIDDIKKLGNDGMRIFSPAEVKGDLGYVSAAMKEVKIALKSEYKPV